MPTDFITRRRALGLIGATGMLPSARPGRAAAGQNPQKTVLLFTKSSGFEHDVVKGAGEDASLVDRTFTDIGRANGFTLVATKDGRVFDGDLGRYNAFAFFTTGDLTTAGTDRSPPMSPRGKQALLAAIRRGKGFIGVHSASDTFHSTAGREADPYIAMLGGEFLSHGSQQAAGVTVIDADFPGLRHAGPGFSITEEWYSLKNFASDLHVLLVLETAAMQEPEYRRPVFPLAWARHEGEGRVYYNAMGHRADVWSSAGFREMLAGAVAWVIGDAEARIAANMAEVTPQAAVLPPEWR